MAMLILIPYVCVMCVSGAAMASNAFRNSFFYDPHTKKLFVHARRLSTSGDFSLVLLNAISHIKVCG